jgi:hypoxanthine phosphoribosyltransferase
MSEEIKINGDTYKLLIEEQQIRDRVKQLAASISADYAGRVPIFIGILNGSFIFLADLIRELTIDCEVDFIKLSSYGDEKISSGQVQLLKHCDSDIKDRDIIVVEDIVDTGLSLSYIKNMLDKENPKSLKFVSLLLKKGTPKISFNVDYIGFEIMPDYVIGYGLDYAQKVRNLKSIYKFALGISGSTE